MLIEISCSRFRKNPVRFHPGLNVVLGDDQGSNSIGKSTLLMLVDFAHGGSDLLKLSPEVAQNLGDHEYYFTFAFPDGQYVFARHTGRPTSILAMSVAIGVPGEWTIKQYTGWLKQQYRIEGEHITFRSAVSPETRVWKRDTLIPDHPLQLFNGEAQTQAVDRLLMLFRGYDDLKELELQLESLDADRKHLANAQKSKFITSIDKGTYEQNQRALRSADAELERIRTNASTLALNIRELVNDEVLEASLEKARLLDLRLQLSARRQRSEMNLAGIGAPKRRAFEALLQFFPDLNLDRLAEVEGFHRELGRILKHELTSERNELAEQLQLLDGQVGKLDERISAATKDPSNPGFLVDRVIAIASEAHRLRQANTFYEREYELANSVRDVRKVRKERRTAQLRSIETALNDCIRELAHAAFPPGRRPPRLDVSHSRYAYDVDQDSGTGTTFAGLVILDLALLRLTALPFAVHDSVLLKNIEVPVMTSLIQLYGEVTKTKQVFISIDEARKYGPAAHASLVENAVAELSREELLYDLDWRSEDSR